MKNIQAQYTDLLEGKMSQANFLRNVRMQFPQYVSNVSSYEDSVKILKGKRILSEEKKPEGVYGHNPSAEVTLYPNFDTVNYNQLMKGMKYELSLMDEITDENLILAKKKALKALTKDPMAYRELMIANQKAVTEMDKDLKMKEAKADNRVDKANGMKVVKKDAPAAANQSAKFTRKVEKVIQMTQTPKKSKGIAKVMEVPGKEKVVALKEALMEEFGKMEVPEQFSTGQRVMSRDKKKVGQIDKIEHDTATIKLDDGSLEHVQLNILTAKDVPAKQEAPKEMDETAMKGALKMKPGVPERLSGEEWNKMSPEQRMEKLKGSGAGAYKGVEHRAKDDWDTLGKYNPGVRQALSSPKKDEPEAKTKAKKALKEKLMKAIKETIKVNPQTKQAVSTGGTADDATANKLGYTQTLPGNITPLGKTR